MADISGLVNDLLGRLTDAAIQEYHLLRSLKDDLTTLRDYFNQIQAVLEDAEEKRRSKPAVELWLKSLRSASAKMENVLDEVSTEALLQKLYKELGMKHRFRAFFYHNPLMFRRRIAHEVKALQTQFNDITAQISQFELIHSAVVNHVDEGISGGIPDRETSSLINSSTVFGRNEEVKRVTEKICNPNLGKNEDDDIPVYAIWGMGGLGKTTLAQLVYNDERVTQHFDFRCWIYVSENFQVKELIKRIIESIDKSKCELSQLDELQKRVQENLGGKRFLVVLDDVWIEDNEMAKWEQLSETLRCGAEGSIVVLTTRSNGTSQMTAKVLELQHELGCLSQEDSWSLFMKFAFAGGRPGEDITEFEPIGKQIVEKCKGLPLALKTLGGLMRLKRKLNEWQHVRDDIWKLPENNILPALKLSYDNLPPHVKRCFAYCCMLPKGHIMGKDVLIWLWKANRLIPSTGEADWYVLAEETLNCLVWRSFFQVADNKYNDTKYKMHDLMHDLARSVMGNDCWIIEPGKQLKVPDEMLHLSSSCPDFPSSQPDLEQLKSLRSVFLFAKEYNKGSVSHIFDQVYLRVLYLDNIGLETLPESICKLKHLRYLNLSHSQIDVLPESVIYLQNLQVLLLNGCWRLRKLPDGMRYMRNLQYLDISGCNLLEYLPVGIGKLTGLRSLPAFFVPKNDGAQIGELGSLNLIGPHLQIKGLDRVKGGLREAQSADLKSKRNLLVLELDWSYSYRFLHDDDEKVLEGLEPNPSLEKLEISCYFGKNISPSWMVNLRSLVQIKLFCCRMCEHISTLGKLPSLRVIRLKRMESLKCLDDDDNILFPKLQVLKIIFCWKLKILPGSLPELKKLKLEMCKELVSLPGNLPKLEVLKLQRCNELVSLPGNLPKLEVLKLEGNEKLVSLPGNLTKLEVLDLLTHEYSFSLPDEIRNFKYLNTLKIRGNANLTRRYAKDIGEDWPKISHIPNISINRKQIRR